MGQAQNKEPLETETISEAQHSNYDSEIAEDYSSIKSEQPWLSPPKRRRSRSRNNTQPSYTKPLSPGTSSTPLISLDIAPVEHNASFTNAGKSLFSPVSEGSLARSSPGSPHGLGLFSLPSHQRTKRAGSFSTDLPLHGDAKHKPSLVHWTHVPTVASSVVGKAIVDKIEEPTPIGPIPNLVARMSFEGQLQAPPVDAVPGAAEPGSPAGPIQKGTGGMVTDSSSVMPEPGASGAKGTDSSLSMQINCNFASTAGPATSESAQAMPKPGFAMYPAANGLLQSQPPHFHEVTDAQGRVVQHSCSGCAWWSPTPMVQTSSLIPPFGNMNQQKQFTGAETKEQLTGRMGPSGTDDTSNVDIRKHASSAFFSNSIPSTAWTGNFYQVASTSGELESGAEGQELSGQTFPTGAMPFFSTLVMDGSMQPKGDSDELSAQAFTSGATMPFFSAAFGPTAMKSFPTVSTPPAAGMAIPTALPPNPGYSLPGQGGVVPASSISNASPTNSNPFFPPAPVTPPRGSMPSAFDLANSPLSPGSASGSLYPGIPGVFHKPIKPLPKKKLRPPAYPSGSSPGRTSTITSQSVPAPTLTWTGLVGQQGLMGDSSSEDESLRNSTNRTSEGVKNKKRALPASLMGNGNGENEVVSAATVSNGFGRSGFDGGFRSVAASNGLGVGIETGGVNGRVKFSIPGVDDGDLPPRPKIVVSPTEMKFEFGQTGTGGTSASSTKPSPSDISEANATAATQAEGGSPTSVGPKPTPAPAQPPTPANTPSDELEKEEADIDYSDIQEITDLPDLLDDTELEKVLAIEAAHTKVVPTGAPPATKAKKKKKKKGGGNAAQQQQQQPQQQQQQQPQTTTSGTPSAPTVGTTDNSRDKPPSLPSETSSDDKDTNETILSTFSKPLIPYRYRRARYTNAIRQMDKPGEWVCFFCEYEQAFGGTFWRRGGGVRKKKEKEEKVDVKG
ncbi:uncharacterized protein SPPG_08665 [Spizellomyces punctatus DAOM BR117]|uniref:Uncharacterized protein n=1 Tax=Spizellomyces punctatus (strain DAOM BR117) TaxID=645134 RepID=A0A0L0H4K2_SPIPD|nr:uncharacterized protein SPPG_08665 [Spizellomyces punctatus DAOM BR117]KNC95904.1 hypothetical protein SPPG_08665 [Spizellomyces punctatus DAOM BR117]|eukprot:XP_016603944.1 hypothetical protein SPPG_08665 [Spizellomyces punctatus DAOM BR117]